MPITQLHIFSAIAASLLLGSCAPVQQLQSAAAAGGALVNSVAATGGQAPLTAAQLRQLQTREFSTTKTMAFASVITVLLDSGYRVLSADMESGLITAAGSAAGHLRLDPTGLARATDTPLASAFVEVRDSNMVRVRVNFTIGRSATGQFTGTGERAVLDESTYANFLDKLGHEIDQRQSIAASLESPPAAIEPKPESKARGSEEAQTSEQADEAITSNLEDSDMDSFEPTQTAEELDLAERG